MLEYNGDSTLTCMFIHALAYITVTYVAFQLEAEKEISQLKCRFMMLESRSNTSLVHVDGTGIKSCDDFHLDLDESIFLVGGYDGVLWSSALDLFSPSHDVLKSLKPMSSVRSYSSVAKLNGELYVFGGGTGSAWLDTGTTYLPLSLSLSADTCICTSL